MLKTFPKLLRDMKLCDRRVRVIVVGYRTIESTCCFGKVDDSDDMNGDGGGGGGDDDDDDDDDPWVPSFC
jgi:hypothetical protein